MSVFLGCHHEQIPEEAETKQMAPMFSSFNVRRDVIRAAFGLLATLLYMVTTPCPAFGLEDDGPPFKFAPTASTRYYKVTSLNDSGRGTLRECAQATGSRVCLFEIGGTIKLNSDIVIKSDLPLIAGQTAPSPGITLTRAGISVRARDVEIEHLAIRPGDSNVGSNASERNAMSVGAGWAPHDKYRLSTQQ